MSAFEVPTIEKLMEKRVTNLPLALNIILLITFIIFFINIEYSALGYILSFLVILSAIIKKRYNLNLYWETGLSVLFTLLIRPDEINAGGNYISFGRVPLLYLQFFLLLNLTIKLFKEKKVREVYMIYGECFLSVLISTGLIGSDNMGISPFLFLMFGISTVIFFHDLIDLTYPRARKQSAPAWKRNMIIVVIVLVFLFTVFQISHKMKANEQKILQALAGNKMLSSSSLFQASTDLAQTENLYQSQAVVMKLFSPTSSGKLRGKVYNNYIKGGRWKTETESWFVDGKQRNIPGFFNVNEESRLKFFSIENISETKMDSASIDEIYMNQSRNHLVYLSYGATGAITGIDKLKIDNMGNLFSISSPVSYSRIIKLPQKFLLESVRNSTYSPEDLKVPEDLLPVFKEHALKITGNKKTIPRKIMAVEQYLQSNYKYKRGIKREKKKMDPVEEFLVEKPSAHCEYFASSMTLLLRSVGIPARYAVGFVVHEYNPAGGYFIVREKDAHAWVEAYIAGKGWVPFDPTPPSDMPGFGSQPKSNWFDAISTRIQVLVQSIKSGSIKKAWAQIRELGISLYKTPVFLTVILIFLVAVFYRLIRILWLKLRGNDKKFLSTEEEKVYQLKKMLEKFDKKIKAKHILRPRHLTLMEFIDFLSGKNLDPDYFKSVREFINDYYCIRYTTEQIDENALDLLKNKLEKIR
ncbi:MAG: transglutaminase-like domain-containing protein [Vulcanimicrobiota bacterium]